LIAQTVGQIRIGMNIRPRATRSACPSVMILCGAFACEAACRDDRPPIDTPDVLRLSSIQFVRSSRRTSSRRRELRRKGVILQLLWEEYVAANSGHRTLRYTQFCQRYISRRPFSKSRGPARPSKAARRHPVLHAHAPAPPSTADNRTRDAPLRAPLSPHRPQSRAPRPAF
jgi:hypothetical protein